MNGARRSSRHEDGAQGEETALQEAETPQPGAEPIEPETGGRRKPVLRWVLFLVFVLWAVLTAYHEPILARIGGYLVVSHDLEEADLIVCLSGGAVERGLAAADLYRKGLAPRVFISPEVPPDGHEALERAGIEIPQSVDILRRILVASGVPPQAVIEAEQPARSTMGEARMVRGTAVKQGYDSLIVITSPTHTRRAWMTFRHATEKDEVAIRMAPSSYSGFRAEDWWRTRRYVREVIVEYQKLLYYTLEYFL
jgi:uncharacterized SAM-binding protein YcdF (DUF218 family)